MAYGIGQWLLRWVNAGFIKFTTAGVSLWNGRLARSVAVDRAAFLL